MEELDSKAINAMRIGGQRFCDESIAMWMVGQYSDMPQAQRLESIQLWRKIKDRIGELCYEISRSS